MKNVLKCSSTTKFTSLSFPRPLPFPVWIKGLPTSPLASSRRDKTFTVGVINQREHYTTEYQVLQNYTQQFPQGTLGDTIR